jgi:hypothetical protein
MRTLLSSTILGASLVLAMGACKSKTADAIAAKAFKTIEPLRKAEDAFQAGADIIRLRHLKYYGQLLEEFRRKTDRCPLGGRRDYPIYVHVGHEGQSPGPDNRPAYRHEVVSMADFVLAIEQGLGRAIEEHYDPQYVAMDRPNFYVYTVARDVCFFAVHVSRAFPFAKEVAPGYFKIEIASRPESGGLDFVKLRQDPEFLAALNAPLDKPGFFEEREQKYLHDTKRAR